jgi:hypothetical protein
MGLLVYEAPVAITIERSSRFFQTLRNGVSDLHQSAMGTVLGAGHDGWLGHGMPRCTCPAATLSMAATIVVALLIAGTPKSVQRQTPCWATAAEPHKVASRSHHIDRL